MPSLSRKSKVESTKPNSRKNPGGASGESQVASHENPLFLISYFLFHRLPARLLPKNKWLRRTLLSFIFLITVAFCSMYGIALWYQHSQAGTQVTLGVSFIPEYASYLGLDVHKTYLAILDDLHVKQLRLVSYWDQTEPSQGTYNFAELDWEMQQAAAHGAKVSLSIGLRQPRWPECHVPSWVDTTKPLSTWQPQLEQFMQTVVNRYKNSPALASYQLENEFYLSNFGTCTDSSTSRLVSEFNLVKSLDSKHPIIMSRSDNLPDWPPIEPKADLTGMSVYRRVYSPPIGRYFTYPLPSWYYAFLAGVQKIRTGHDSVLHELQTEPWAPNGQTILSTSLAEQNKSFNATRLQSTVKFGEQTGLKHIDLWGAEYWYYRATTLHDPSVWNTAKSIFSAKSE